MASSRLGRALGGLSGSAPRGLPLSDGSDGLSALGTAYANGYSNMKSVCVFLGAGLIPVLIGCSSTQVALAPVGPNPAGISSTASQGKLQVFSSLDEQSDDQSQASPDPIWHQHTDYSIFDLQGKRVEHVDNTTGHYARAPRLVDLPAGRYVVKAQAKDYFWMEVPVTIEAGRTTRVHLDGKWQPPTNTSTKGLVSMPNGTPAGWGAEPIKGIEPK